MFLCDECGEGLATYANSNEKNCENPICSLVGIDQANAVYVSEQDLIERGHL